MSIASDNIKKERYEQMDECMHDWGYSFDSFEVTTEDGYILTTFRVTGNLNDTSDTRATKNTEELHPVIINSGYTCDATCWVTADPTGPTPTPLRLFDEGYDVWMM